MLEKVKLALRITTDAFDSELTDMIEAAYLDLGLAGVTPVMPEDPLIIRGLLKLDPAFAYAEPPSS